MYIDSSQVDSINAASASGSVNNPFQKKRRTNQVAESRLGREYATVLHGSLQYPAVDENAVKQAKEAVLSGQVDQYESARQAAKKLLQYGI